MTLDTYADLFDEDLDEVANRLNEAIQVTRTLCGRRKFPTGLYTP